MRSTRIWILSLVAAMAIAPALARVDFMPVEGGEFLLPVDTTPDGSMMLFTSLFGSGVWTYTADQGLAQIGTAACSGQPRMSTDGTVIVGNEKDAGGVCQAARYDGGGSWTLMGSEPGGLPCGTGVSSSYDTNNDTAVGLFWTAQLCRAIGGTWDVNAGIAGPRLDTTVPDRPTRGNAISDDGTVIGGWQDAPSGERNGVLWINGVQEYLVDTDGSLFGEVIGMNTDATVLWGTSYHYNGTGVGWLWVDGQGYTPMGRGGIGRNIQSVPLGASADGSVVIGITRDFDQFVEQGWIWSAKHGWQDFDDFLKGQAGRGWQIMIPTVISADGNVIGGRGINPNGQLASWIVNLKASGNPNN